MPKTNRESKPVVGNSVLCPELLPTTEVESAFDDFAGSYLSEDTSVRSFLLKDTGLNLTDTVLNEQEIQSFTLRAEARTAGRFHCFFVNRFLVRSKRVVVPSDATKLRVSRVALEHIVSMLGIPLAFVFALSRHYLPSGQGYHSKLSGSQCTGSDFWYTLPVRMQVMCTDSQRGHVTSTAGSNQMNPFYYLHLSDQAVDIRGSQIALNFRYTNQGNATAMLAVNFIDGRWPKTVQEPELRIKEILNDGSQSHLSTDPFFVHLVYLNSVVKWWTNALKSIHDQLIAYEVRLQDDETTQPANTTCHQDINRALHAMAAHLHRYTSELTSIEDTIAAIGKYHAHVMGVESVEPSVAFNYIEQGLFQIASQLKAVQRFEQELEKKIQNSLALLFNRIQLSNDRVVVANGIAMQEIMRATQEETKVSRGLAVKAHKLSEAMKKDSLSMKTIAILTMFFLPGTSFAAILSTPFFNNSHWLEGPARLWIWIVLTVPSTGLAFAFYSYRQSQNAAKVEDYELA